MRIAWSPELVDRALKVLTRCRTIAEAAKTLSAETGLNVTYPALWEALCKRGYKLGQYLGTALEPIPSPVVQTSASPSLPPPGPRALPPEPGPEGDPDVAALQAALKKGAVSLTDLCDRLDKSPKRVQEIIAKARALGMALRVDHDHLSVGVPDPGPDGVQVLDKVAPVVGVPLSVGVVSDLHAGSKYILREQLVDCVEAFYAKGIRTVLVPGDMLDGVYHFSMYEQTHPGFALQLQDLIETLPQKPGLEYHAITGNHDETFFTKGGLDVCQMIEAGFVKRGRNDFHMHGRRHAFVRINGAVVDMWHPTGGAPYARSYALQKKCEEYSWLKPQVMLAGHWHTFAMVDPRSIQAIACPTFQGGGGRRGSEFGNSLRTSPSIGGLILTWTLTRDGSIRDFTLSRRAYYEHEKPVEIVNRMDAIPVDLDVKLK